MVERPANTPSQELFSQVQQMQRQSQFQNPQQSYAQPGPGGFAPNHGQQLPGQF